jgi:hypothetical protein
MRFPPQWGAFFADLFAADLSAPAALATYSFESPEQQNSEKTQHFAPLHLSRSHMRIFFDLSIFCISLSSSAD